MNPVHERPSRPLTWGEQDRFADLAVLASARPPHTTRYATPAGRARLLARRVARSRFADDLRHAARGAFWPAVACSALLVGLVVAAVTRGVYVDWSGFQPIPTEAGTR